MSDRVGAPRTNHSALVSVIIPAHNEQQALPSLLESLGAQECEDRAYEVLVVADACTDQTVSLASAFRIAQIIEITARNVIQARNVGAARAKGSLLFFVDADHLLKDRQFLDALIRVARDLHHRPVVGTTSAVPREQSYLARAFLEFRSKMIGWNLLTVANGGVFIDAHLFRQVGGYRPETFTFEHRDLMRRALRAGAHFVYLRSVTLEFSMRRYEHAGYARTLGWWCRTAARRLLHRRPLPYPPASVLISKDRDR